jgi:hypothetical protein
MYFSKLPLDHSGTGRNCKIWLRLSNIACFFVEIHWNFVPKKFRGIDSERFPLLRGRKCSFRGIPSSAEEPIPKLGTEQNGTESRGKNEVLRNSHGRYDYSDIEPGLNWRPHPCNGCMMTTKLRNSKMTSPYLKSRLF